MSVKLVDSQRSFYHADYLCAELFGSANRYRLFREKILPKLFSLRSQLDVLYCENNGRPAIDPVLLVGVTLLQFMEAAPDRVAAERALYHLRLEVCPGFGAYRGWVSPHGVGLF